MDAPRAWMGSDLDVIMVGRTRMGSECGVTSGSRVKP